ncbi:diguanylate cyclase (GGDEF) domain-containing protein [Quadrisphaera granulorum]|uniref:Diguanylate cyclase (GGDEF)-like protein n=1 Tax=Quadrisphaera granulorum TaxID=317664 RepID=A0A316A5F4_9ACTN|nr:EAL domain-containing protein [Quadrisphaera granulorum]PWJ52712.1 diguanylate cyclase (GGDEF)-like protein [Quadrisphaera granulorum]SZE97534.1 diguanylate cyclase (GGDEF) domain-containing protein [Quadrisphaera granulorum]
MSEVPRALLETTLTRCVDELSVPLRRVSGSTACWQVDAAFRSDPDLLCLAVIGDDDHAGEDDHDDDAGHPRTLGLVSRGAFLSAMSGRYGYGRSLHGRRPIATLAEHDVLVLDADTSVPRAAELLLARERAQRFSELLVRRPDGTLRLLEAEQVFRALSAQLAVEALTDQLTGLANRAHFMRRLGEVCAGPGSVVVAFVDLDDFKAVNDSSGHVTGDQLLRRTAERLRACGGPDGVVARLGGDEFAVLLPGAGPADAQHLAILLQAELSRPHDLGGRLLPGRASVGVAMCTALPAEPSALLHEADLAMYRAKQSGGRRSEVVDASWCSGATPPAPDHRAFHAAAERGELEVHYQPIVEVVTGRLRSLEALVRWRHPLRGLLAPGDFLDDAAAAGFSAELDVHVLRTALAQQARWEAEHGPAAPAHLNVNLTVAGLLMPDLPAVVARELERAGVRARTLRLELPEVATAAHVRAAAPTLEALRALGVALTLDDVGSGAAGLSHLSELHVDGLKIDRRFVERAPVDERSAVVVRTLVELGHGLGVPVTAEGAEGAVHLALLRGLAPGRTLLVQGSVVSPPLHPDDVPALWSDPAPDGVTAGVGRSPSVSARDGWTAAACAAPPRRGSPPS